MVGQEDFGRGTEEFWEANADLHPHRDDLSQGWKGATYVSIV